MIERSLDGLLKQGNIVTQNNYSSGFIGQ